MSWPKTTYARRSAGAGENLVALAVATDSLSTLTSLVKAAGLVDALSQAPAGGFTLFAPNNMAFEKLKMMYPGIVDFLLKNPAVLKRVLLYHVHKGGLSATDITMALKGAGGSINISSLAGPMIMVARVQSGAIILNGSARVVAADFKTADGSIAHVIDSVLVPPDVARMLSPPSHFKFPRFW